jgi:hypothetical protein
MEAAARSVLSHHYPEVYEKMTTLERVYRNQGPDVINWKGHALMHWSPVCYYENKYNRNLGVMLITIGFPDIAYKMLVDEHEMLFTEKYKAHANLRTTAMYEKLQLKRLNDEIKSLTWEHKRTMSKLKKLDAKSDEESVSTPGQEGPLYLSGE